MTITNGLAAIVFWLAREKSPLPDTRDLAREWFSVRLPSPEQLTFAGALFDGFLLNHKDWSLWQHVGRLTRTPPDQVLLSRFREQLRERFRKVNIFHQQVAAAFWRPVTSHQEFEPDRHRRFIDATVNRLRNCVSALAALAIHENSPRDSAPVAARFCDWILCAGKPKPQITDRVAAKLAATFPGSAFNMEGEPVMTTLVILRHLQIGNRRLCPGDELPPHLLPAAAIDLHLDRKELVEYDSADRRSLYRLIHVFSDCSQTEPLTPAERNRYALSP